jgi:hypothetical protein
MPAKKLKPPPPLSPRDGDPLLLVGTMKGLFLLHADRGRRSFRVSGPHFPGSSVYAAAFDFRAGRRRIWAAPSSMHWGAELCWSDDFGKTWSRPRLRVRFPDSSGATLKNIWQISPGRADEPDTLYCGVKPSALFESRDAGKTWTLNAGLWNHPHRAKWMPGGGGLYLHTVLVDPRRPGRMVVATSTGGAYRTDDGGRSWHVKNRGVRAEYLPDPFPEFGQCVHKIAQNAVRPDRLFLQNHWGLYRSDDGGDSWTDVANGVPSDFGFCVGIHPRDPDTAFVLPIHSDGFRCTPEGKLRVYRTTTAEIWQGCPGFPRRALETVVRDAHVVDSLDPAGVYFGTRSDAVRLARRRHDWTVADGLPPIVCVKAAVAANSRAKRVANSRAKRRAANSRAKRRAANPRAKKPAARSRTRRPAA